MDLNKYKIYLLFVLVVAVNVFFVQLSCAKTGLAGEYVKYSINGSEIKLQEKTSKYITELKDALKVKPNDSDLLYKLGKAYSDAGDENFAVIYYKKAIIVDNKNADSYYGLGISYKNKKNNNEAIKALNKGLSVVEKMKNKPDFDVKSYKIKSQWVLADIYASMKNKYQTNKYLQAILKIKPDEESAAYNLQNFKKYRD